MAQLGSAVGSCPTGRRFESGSRYMADLEDTIEQKAAEPESAEAAGVRVKQRPLKDLIEADKHLGGKTAAGGRSPRLLVNRLVPPGSV